jgi:hypothetical protein
MDLLSEDEWNNLRNAYIIGSLSQHLREYLEALFPDNEHLIPMITFSELTLEQKRGARDIWILNELGDMEGLIEGGRKHRRSKKYKRTRRHRVSKKRRHGRKSRKHR